MSKLAISGSSDGEPRRLERQQERESDHGGHDDSERSESAYAEQSTARPIPTAEDCLRALAQLPGLVALGVLKPAQANAIRATFREILQHHQRAQSRQGRDGLSTPDILDLARNNPHILSMLEPILTEEQIHMAMRAAKDGEGGQA